MFREQIINQLWIIIEFLTPVEGSNFDVAQYCAGGKTETSEDEKIVIQIQATMNPYLQYQANDRDD